MANQGSPTSFIAKRCRTENEFCGEESFSIDNLDLDSDVIEFNCPELTSHDPSIVGKSTEGCSSECCDEDLCEPYHPKCDILKTKRRQGKQYRVFQMKWFDDHD